MRFSIVGPEQERYLSRAAPACFAVVSATGGQPMAPLYGAREREQGLASMAAVGRDAATPTTRWICSVLQRRAPARGRGFSGSGDGASSSSATPRSMARQSTPISGAVSRSPVTPKLITAALSLRMN